MSQLDTIRSSSPVPSIFPSPYQIRDGIDPELLETAARLFPDEYASAQASSLDSETLRLDPSIQRPDYILHDSDLVMGENDVPYVLRVRDLADQDKPREKLQKYGPSELSMAEIVAILLSVGTRREDVLQMAHRILKEYGERAMVYETNPRHLSETIDIPYTKACQLIAGFELGRRFYQNRGGKPVVVRTARQAFEHLKSMGSLQKEQLRALYLGSRYQLVHEEDESMGSLTANIVHPREVFQPAITYGAVAVIIAHNHPSGSLEPTEADAEVTYQLIEGGKLLGIELLDHLIIAEDSYLSMMEEKA
jgi:DNA repair protein RadC